MTTPTYPPRFKPQAFALRLLALVFGTELAVMWFLSRFPGITGWTEMLADAVLLSLGIAPILWFWLHQAERARLQAESELRDKDAEVERSLTRLNRLRLALDRHAIVAITDPEGRILEANDAFCAITGYSRGELVGKIHCSRRCGPAKSGMANSPTTAGREPSSGSIPPLRRSPTPQGLSRPLSPSITTSRRGTSRPRSCGAVRCNFTSTTSR